MKLKIVPFIVFFIYIVPGTAQYSDTIYSEINTSKITKKDVLIPAILLGASLICFTDNEILDNTEFREFRNKHLWNFHSDLDDYLQFAPIALVYISDLLGVKSKSTFWKQSLVLLKSEILMELFVVTLKITTNEKRPNGSDYLSFPSGHTAEAFMAATFLHKEFGEQSIYYSIAGYSIATTVGLLRMANNEHWASDVLAGAAFGILATNLSYKTMRSKSKTKISHQFNLEPSYSNKNFQMGINFTF